jgi:rhodanese-related sulfurtransferase
VTRFRQQLGLWIFLITGGVVHGFDPEKDGMEGIKSLVRSRFGEVRQLPTKELAAWLNDTNRPPPQLLDIREPAEFAVSHLPGARRIDPGAKPAEILAKIATNRPVVVYCSVGYRSSGLARRLLNAGMTNVVNLEGSIFQWANEGRPLVKDDGPAKRVHPYNERWGALLKPEIRGAAD